MATKFILSKNDLEKAELKPRGARAFSLWLSERLEGQLRAMPEWQLAHPVVTGSWARGEICPKSDLDVVFTGPEDVVAKLVNKLQLVGLRIRYRVPANLADWSEGVEPFDVLALLQGRGETPLAEQRLQEQLKLLAQKGARSKQRLFRAMQVERKARTKRYDSIANFLEPNIKYGAGGLRDLEQALMLVQLFPEKFTQMSAAIATLQESKSFLLSIRQKLQLSGASDHLVATEQAELATWFHYSSRQEFMRDVQRALQDVSFLADVVAERAAISGPRLKDLEALPLHNVGEQVAALLKEPDSLWVQYRISQCPAETSVDPHVGRALERILTVQSPDGALVGLFRSGLMHRLFSHLQRLRGWVQHDQYHRFSADAHLLQTLREVQRARHQPQRLGGLQKFSAQLSAGDWRILMWTALYHDMAKGLGGDHAIKGRELVAEEMPRLGLPESLVSEVQWMVAHHLLLSEAAFRKNPRAPSTLRELHDRGVEGRVGRLAVFTAIDICATNPDAWNQWKESLLVQLAETLVSRHTGRYFDLFNEETKRRMDPRFLDHLDPDLIEALPAKMLFEEYQDLSAGQLDLAPRVWRSRTRQTWVRFHAREDRAGLFAEFVDRLYACGVSITRASVQTYAEWGAYDWFCIKAKQTPAVLTKLLSVRPKTLVALPDVRFDSIRVMGQDEHEWVISFRGRDQRGALRAAAQALRAEGLTIQWARVHTWGRQIDDIFGVKPSGADLKALLSRIQERWSVT